MLFDLHTHQKFYVDTEEGKGRESRVNSKPALLWYQGALSTPNDKNPFRSSILKNILTFFSECVCVLTYIRKTIGVVRYKGVKENFLMQFANKRGKRVWICVCMSADSSSQPRSYL